MQRTRPGRRQDRAAGRAGVNGPGGEVRGNAEVPGHQRAVPPGLPVSLPVGKAACYPLAAAQTGGVRRFTGLVGRVVVYRWFSRVTRSAISDHGNAGNAAGQDGAVVTVYENGPLIVRGRFAVTAQDGQPIPAGRGTVALCRCGRSAIKPFCDGSHARTGFRAPGGALGTRPAAQNPDGGRGTWERTRLAKRATGSREAMTGRATDRPLLSPPSLKISGSLPWTFNPRGWRIR